MNPILLCPILFEHYLESCFEKEVKVDHTKIGTAYLDSPCQEFSNCGLGFVVYVFSGNIFSWISTGGLIQL